MAIKRFLVSIILMALLAISTTMVFGAEVKIIAYYFHGNARCSTCHKMEQYAKEAIEENFKDELANGLLVFKAVNVEEKENEHFVNDYQLYTKSLVLSLVKDGKELKHKNLAKIWEYVRNKEKYTNYIKSEVGTFLKEMQ